jgi:hypothetical protein
MDSEFGGASTQMESADGLLSTSVKNVQAWMLRLPATLRFLPWLILYAFIANDPAPEVFEGDEARYVASGKNLVQLSYSRPDMRQLWNGPGYPAFLALLFRCGATLQVAHLANAVLLFAAVLLVYRTLLLYCSQTCSTLSGMAFATYWPIFKSLPGLLTETLTVFLFSASIYLVCLCHRDRRTRHVILASVTLAWLAMTKVILGYVIVASLLIYGLLWGVTRRQVGGRLCVIYAGALVLCLPYLSYTFSVTGKTFYWSSAGGSSLYWMSYPGPETLGEWKSSSAVAANPPLLERHRGAVESIRLGKMSPIERDAALRKLAYANATHHPRKYLQNWLANWSRMFFNFPFKSEEQRLSTCFTVLPNLFVLSAAALSIFVTVRLWKQVPLEIHAILILEMLYLGASSLASAYPRMFYVTMPAVAVFVTFALSHGLHLRPSLLTLPEKTVRT